VKISVIVCIAATIGTLPFIIYYFNRVSSITIIANLIAVPLLGEVALAISMLAIIFSFSPILAGFFIKAASIITQISVIIINKLADLSWSVFTITKPSIFEIILFYLFFILLIKFIDTKRVTAAKNESQKRFQFFLLYGLIFVFTLFISTTVYFSVKDKFSSNLKITAIDVGQGNSTLVRFPHGKTMLIDGGGFPDSTFDMGKMVLAPYLYHERISYIDTVVLTHPHPDHYEGLKYILENFDVKEFWTTGYDTCDEDYIALQKIITEKNIKKVFLSRQTATININGADINILWPLKPYLMANSHYSSDNATNDSSLVFKIKYGDIAFLITGDISSEIEEQLVQAKLNIKSSVLVVPHHGSKHSSSPDFIKNVSAICAVASAGKNNVFHHPHPSVIRRYEDAGVHILRTDQDGAVTFTTDGVSLSEDTFIKIR
jgi:competence protein ComEC